MERTILHIDMDAFYASVEQRDNPEFMGKPVIVGAAPKLGRGRGVVSAASYEARRYDVHSALPISQAYRRCPHGIFLPGRGKRYVQVSRAIMSIFREYTPLVEAISLDEAFLDVSGSARLFGDGERMGWEIKNRIQRQERLTASVGIGPNKLIAKIASDLEKPDGFVVVHPENTTTFLAPLSVNKLWGIGKKTEAKMATLGIHTVGQLAAMPESTLQDLFGKSGPCLRRYARGIDDSSVHAMRNAKSVSNEITFESDQTDPDVIYGALLKLSEKVGYRLRKQETRGRTVALKVRLSDFSTMVRHNTLSRATAMGETIYREARSIYAQLDTKGQPIRLLGVGMTQLQSGEPDQISLFDEDDPKLRRMSKAVDHLKAKYGERVIGKGGAGSIRKPASSRQ